MTEPSQITRAQERAIVALLDTKDLAVAAQRAGVEVATVLSWLGRDTAFVAAFSHIGEVRDDEAFCALMAELEWEWSS